MVVNGAETSAPSTRREPSSPRLRLLFVTYFFPPYHSVGAVRTGQTADYLAALGHDVRVVTAGRQAASLDLALELPPDHVRFTPWLGWRVARSISRQGAGADGAAKVGVGARTTPLSQAKRLLRLAQRNVFYMPDDCIGWYPYALAAALRLARSTPFDLIYASAGPQTSLLVAATAARCCNIPWVGELRDLWSDNHYRDLAPWFHGVDARIEANVLGTASGLVTVSQPWADHLARKYSLPVRTVYNGFEERPAAPSGRGDPEAPLLIAYLGSLYGGKRDPTPLFQAIRELGADAGRVRVEFYGPGHETISALARACGVEASVLATPEVSYADSLRVQSAADVLLLVMWDTQGEQGVLPGKLFEYLGARRPVLAVGAPQGGAAATLITERHLGLASSDPKEIARRLRAWISEKRASGGVEPLPAAAAADFSRQRQVARLSEFFWEVHEHAGRRAQR